MANPQGLGFFKNASLKSSSAALTGMEGVRSGSPAEEAGLTGGDVIVRFADKDVQNIYDYTYALREHAPGDTVSVRVRRGDEVVDMTAVLGQRN